jgi:hypothetical protein
MGLMGLGLQAVRQWTNPRELARAKRGSYYKKIALCLLESFLRRRKAINIS